MTLEVILSTAFGVETPVQTEDTNNKFLIESQEAFKAPQKLRVFFMLPFSILKITQQALGEWFYFC